MEEGNTNQPARHPQGGMKMESFRNLSIKWTYVTHLVDRSVVSRLLPMEPMNGDSSVGALVLGRVIAIGKHTALEAPDGRRTMLFPGDVIAGALGNRYATDQFEGTAVASGPTGHILGIGGVCGEVVSKNEKMPDPTVVEWLGRLADADGTPINLNRFARRERSAPSCRPRTLLTVGASMDSGKTTTAAHAVRCFTVRGHRVVAAKITGTACRKDIGIMEDAGALLALDFTHCGYPSTASCDRTELVRIASDLRASLLAEEPDYVVLEIADGIFQRETRLLLEDPGFRSTIDAVLFAGVDSVSCDGAARYLTKLGYHIAAVAGIVGNSRLGRAEVEEMTGLPCLSREMMLGGSLAEVLRVTWAA